MRTLRTAVCLCALLASLGATAQDRPPGPFDQGRIRASLSGGTSFGAGDSYIVIGAGVGYFVIDGLEIGLQFESWFGQDPTVNKLSPQVRYVFYMVPVVHPYLGGFYRHWFIADQEDLDTLGGSVGIAFVSNRYFFAGGGVVHEVVLDCDDDCSETYPEFFVGVSF